MRGYYKNVHISRLYIAKVFYSMHCEFCDGRIEKECSVTVHHPIPTLSLPTTLSLSYPNLTFIV